MHHEGKLKLSSHTCCFIEVVNKVCWTLQLWAYQTKFIRVIEIV